MLGGAGVAIYAANRLTSLGTTNRQGGANDSCAFRAGECGEGKRRYAVLTSGMHYGTFGPMKPARKITVHIPGDLLKQAQKSTGQGITETVRRGLQLVAAGEAYRQLREMRGKMRVSIDLKTLREDR